MRNRFAFTMIELIFVIMIMGVLGKYGIEFLSQAYNNFIFSKINNNLQENSTNAIETIASRLQFRIKDSVVARVSPDNGGVQSDYQALPSSTYDTNATILEWIGSDIEGFRGTTLPLWSGVIDLDPSTYNILNTPETNTTALNDLIDELSGGDSNISDAAIYFVGSASNINRYGWDGNALIEQNTSSIHPIDIGSNVDEFISGIAGVDFNDTDVFEYYELSWTAYAVELNTTSHDLWLHYDYQPWNGDTYLKKSDNTKTKKALIMKNVDTFRFMGVGSVIKIQVCAKSSVMEYSLCKEKTIF